MHARDYAEDDEGRYISAWDLACCSFYNIGQCESL